MKWYVVSLYIDNDKYKNSRLKCEENDSCQLKTEDEKQRLELSNKFNQE